MKLLSIVLAVAGALIVTGGCVSTSEYSKQQAAATSELPAYEQAFKDQDCFNLRFRFTNNMDFGEADAIQSLKCLEIERTRNNLRAWSSGIIEDDELTASHAYDNYRAIFTYLARGELPLARARELFGYAAEKSRLAAQAEMARSNELVVQGLENQRRALEQQNAAWDRYMESLSRNAPKAPVVTTCRAIMNTVECTTQ